MANLESEMVPPSLTTGLTIFMFTLFWLLGKARDFFGRRNAKGRCKVKGVAPALDPQADFYQRRVFSRMKDLWNRPIASAPDAWVDVIERSNLSYTSGTKPIELLNTTKRCLNLGSYNYLGFAAADKYCTPRVQATITEMGVSTCSPRRAVGTTPIHEELERMVAKFVGKEASLTFGMGFATNSATLPALVGKGSLILSDKLNHTSIVVGARTSGAHIKVFKHNDPKHLEMVLRDAIARGQPKTGRPWKKVLIVVEGIYSMEGDVCALREIVEVKKRFGAYLFLDEAHSIGAMGATGRGVCEHWGVDPADIDIMMGTFTKSFGSCGGYIAASREVIDFLLRHSPAHLYATAMSPAAAQQALSALKLLNGEDGTTRGVEKVRQLHKNSNYFRRRLLDMGLSVSGDWDSPVMPVMIYFPGKLPAVSRMCLERSVAMVVVGFPATEMNLARARVCISASHTEDDLAYGVEVLDDVMSLCMCKYGRAPEPRPHPLLSPSTLIKEVSPVKPKQVKKHTPQQSASNGKRINGHHASHAKCRGFGDASAHLGVTSPGLPAVAHSLTAR